MTKLSMLTAATLASMIVESMSLQSAAVQAAPEYDYNYTSENVDTEVSRKPAAQAHKAKAQ